MSEKLLFPSKEWMDKLVDLLKGNADYKKAAGNWEGSLALVIEAEEGKLDKKLIFYADPYHGEIRAHAIINNIEEKNPDFVINGPYSVWKEIQKGNMDTMQAIMKGKVKVKGNMAALLKQVKATQVMMKLLEEIPTKYVDEEK
jgi:putative sterol carrier protein